MSIIDARIRLLANKLKRFFNTMVVLPVRVLTAFRVVVPYENALHRIVVWSTGDGFIDCGTVGEKLIKKVPVGEIWILESIKAYLTTGSTARLEQIKIARKGGTIQGLHTKVTAAASFAIYRGIDFGENMWAYAGDVLYCTCSTNNATDLAAVDVQVRILRVGDDF